MKAAIVKTNSIIEIKNLETPPLDSHEILVKMQACGICGSDVEKVFGKYGQPSMRLGHEPAGIITQVGSQVSEFDVGDRVFTHHHVACRSCHHCSHGNETMCSHYHKSNLEPCGLADEYIVPAWNLEHGGVLKIPDDMSFEEAAMIEPLACCIRAWNKFNHHKRDSAAILGVGPTGIMHAILAKFFGFGKVFCLDLNDYRLRFATTMYEEFLGPGVALHKFEIITIRSDNPDALEQIKSETEYDGVDVVIVATSSLKALQDAINFVSKGGTIVMFGVPSKGAMIDLDMDKIYSKEINIVSSYAASDFDTKDALEKISSKKIRVKQLITHRYNLDESQKAFEHAKTGKDAMKIIINN